MCISILWRWFGKQFAFLEMFIPHSSYDLIAIWNCVCRCFVLVKHIEKAFGSTVCMCIFLFWCWFGEQFAFFEMFFLHSSCDLIAIWNCARRCFVLVDVENTTFVNVPCKKSNSLLGMLVPARRAESKNLHLRIW